MAANIIKIFAGEKPVYFTNELSKELKEIEKKGDTVFYKNAVSIDPEKILADLETKKAAVILSGNIDSLKEIFINHFERIDAAGGIVQNEQKEILFIFRRGKWDLPKGKKETGESAEICAAREVEEETGVGHLTLKKKIGITRHIYKEKDKQILKQTDWFWFTTAGIQDTRAQTEEDITEVCWIATKNIREPMLNTYESIRDIMHAFFDEP